MCKYIRIGYFLFNSVELFTSICRIVVYTVPLCNMGNHPGKDKHPYMHITFPISIDRVSLNYL